MSIIDVSSHEQRLAGLDPLLPAAHPLPAPGPGDVMLDAAGGVALYQLHRPDPESLMASWGAAEQHRLLARVGGPDPEGAMRDLLAQWSELVHQQAAAGDPDTEAVITWPTRDTTMTRLFLDHGLVPAAVIAARPAHRPTPSGSAQVRPLGPADVDAAADRFLEVVRWDSQFSSVTERPSSVPAFRRDLDQALEGKRFWAWVAGAPGTVDALLMLDPPEHTGWVAPMVSRAPVAYLGTLGVAPHQRSTGIGTALVGQAHAALDAAGVAVTVLHYGALNPLSGPFWHRCGYRPLWTVWEAHPASLLRAPGPGRRLA